jgi:hypothetical protein
MDVLNFLIAKPDVEIAVAALGSAVAAIAAVFLSLLSLAVSLYVSKHQRTHNQLTVRPLAYVMVGDYENQLFVKLRNNGTGPMIVSSSPTQNKAPVSHLQKLATAILWLEQNKANPALQWIGFAAH